MAVTDTATGHATGHAEVDTAGASVGVELLSEGSHGVITLSIDAGSGEMNILLNANAAELVAEQLRENAERLRDVNDD